MANKKEVNIKIKQTQVKTVDRKQVFENGRLRKAKQVVAVKNNKTKKVETPVKVKAQKQVSRQDFLTLCKDLENTTAGEVDKWGYVALWFNKKRVLTYLSDTRYGFGFYTRNDKGTWDLHKVTNESEMRQWFIFTQKLIISLRKPEQPKQPKRKVTVKEAIQVEQPQTEQPKTEKVLATA